MEISKPLEDLILAHANLIPDAFSAFRQGNFPKSIDLFNRALDQDKNNWQVRLYLAMACGNTGNLYAAALHFRYLQQNCTEPDVVSKSTAALSALEKKGSPAPPKSSKAGQGR